MRLLFVGERRSATAIRRGWRWEDGRLAAKQLFDALRAIGIEPSACRFRNAFEDDMAEIRVWGEAGWVVVGLGKKAQGALRAAGVWHIEMAHPAARGAIRLKGRYAEHVARALGF